VYSLGIAYLLWFLSGFGALGFHRFYLNKIGTGLLFMLTGGLGCIGSIYDFFTLPRQVREANLRNRYQEVLDYQIQSRLADERGKTSRRPQKKESLERIILRTGKKNKGRITPSEIALEADIAIEEAKKQLDRLAAKGFIEMRVSKSGIIVYIIPDFLADPSDLELEDF